MKNQWFAFSLMTLAGAVALQAAEPLFAPPVRLTVDGKPVNLEEDVYYPSPVLHDIDGDKQPELVVGNLYGTIRVYKQKGDDDTAFTGGDELKSGGEVLELPNW